MPPRPRQSRQPRGQSSGWRVDRSETDQGDPGPNSISDGFRDVVERGRRIGADRRNGRQADDDNQRQHHGVLNSGRSIL